METMNAHEYNIRNRAFECLKQRYPGIVKHGLHQLCRRLSEGGEGEDLQQGFIPFATLFDEEQKIIRLFDFETSITDQKLFSIERWGHNFYDLTGYYSELWAIDKFGLEQKRVWRVKDGIAWTYAPTGEWLSDSEIERREGIDDTKSGEAENTSATGRSDSNE
jgi:hypothetical protein